MAEVEAGNVLNLLVKDMSRMGRDHVQVGMYLEIFRQRGIRFIAFELPAHEPTTGEIAAEEKLERQRERKRRNTKRFLEKRRQETEKAEQAAQGKTA